MRKWGDKVSFFKGFLVHMVEANQRSVLGNYVYDWIQIQYLHHCPPQEKPLKGAHNCRKILYNSLQGNCKEAQIFGLSSILYVFFCVCALQPKICLPDQYSSQVGKPWLR
jgi:hypothetical protein